MPFKGDISGFLVLQNGKMVFMPEIFKIEGIFKKCIELDKSSPKLGYLVHIALSPEMINKATINIGIFFDLLFP